MKNKIDYIKEYIKSNIKLQIYDEKQDSIYVVSQDIEQVLRDYSLNKDTFVFEIDVSENTYEIFRLKRNDISGDLTVRARRTGDKICLNRRQGSKTLKKLFIEKKIPAERRDRIPIIADNEKIIAIPHLGRAAELSAESEADCVIVIKQIIRSCGGKK